HPAAQGDPGRLAPRGGGAAQPPGGGPGQLPAGVTGGGHHPRGLVTEDLEGAGRGGGDEQGKGEELGLTWLAEIGAHGVVAGPDASLHEQPAQAVRTALAKEGISPADLDLVEINEAFAAVGLVSSRALGLSQDRVNVNGGAIA